MEDFKKTFLTELFWVIVSIIFEFLLIKILFPVNDNDIFFEIINHDTFYVLTRSAFNFHFFILIYLSIHLFRQIWFRFQNLFSNISILVLSLILIVVVSSYIDFYSQPGIIFSSVGWTIYPPLSSSSTVTTISDSYREAFLFKFWIMEYILGLIVIVFAWVIFKFRKNHKSNPIN